jgi:hypothetical protein
VQLRTRALKRQEGAGNRSLSEAAAAWQKSSQALRASMDTLLEALDPAVKG